jgi:hypothetical protein
MLAAPASMLCQGCSTMCCIVSSAGACMECAGMCIVLAAPCRDVSRPWDFFCHWSAGPPLVASGAKRSRTAGFGAYNGMGREKVTSPKGSRRRICGSRTDEFGVGAGVYKRKNNRKGCWGRVICLSGSIVRCNTGVTRQSLGMLCVFG